MPVGDLLINFDANTEHIPTYKACILKHCICISYAYGTWNIELEKNIVPELTKKVLYLLYYLL